jgi:uncharacterized protein (UPF0332 family)
MTTEERIGLARESREEAGLLSRERLGSKAVLAKLYHAMMQSIFALFGIRDMGRRTHADVIEQFEQEYVATDRVDKSVLGALRRTYDLTHECDCDHMPVPTDDDIGAAERAADALIRRAAALTKKEGPRHESEALRR